MKLDLHTHCFEALSFAQPTEAIVDDIVRQIKGRGLDGIAITDHDYWMRHKETTFAYEVKEIVSCLYPDVLIIPGQELFGAQTEVVELYLPRNLVFRFLAHPGYPNFIKDNFTPDNLQGIEIHNCLHHWSIDQEWVTEVTDKYNLLPLSNSDAHILADTGTTYSEIDLGLLCSRALSRYP